VTRPTLPRAACRRCGTVYFVISETRLRALGYDATGIERYRRCRCGASDFARATDGDAPALVTLTAIVTDAIDQAEVEAWENYRAALEG